MIPLQFYLLVAALLFCIGLFGALARRNAVAILMGVELMLNAVNINLVAFWRYIKPASPANDMAGQVFALIVVTLAAAEAAIGLALIIAIYRSRDTVNIEDVDLMKW